MKKLKVSFRIIVLFFLCALSVLGGEKSLKNFLHFLPQPAVFLQSPDLIEVFIE
jgi:hypothetical protein